MTEFLGKEIDLHASVLASLGGAFVFGLYMTILDMMPMVAGLVRSDSLFVAWLLQFTIGTVFGLAFAVWVAFARLPPISSGLLYGFAVWTVGPLLLMPLFLGMPGAVYDLTVSTPWYSLVGHLVFGLTLGVGYRLLTESGADEPRGHVPA